MLKDLFRYTRERSPLWLVTLIGAVLYTAGVTQWNFSVGRYFVGLVTMIIYLTLLRLSDDICDIPVDRRNHPERLLVSGAVNVAVLKKIRWIGIAMVFVIHLFYPGVMVYPKVMALFAVVLLFYGIYFAIKSSLSLHLQLAMLNLYLFVFPVYAGLFLNNHLGTYHLLMGLFFWLGGMAHDYSHAIVDTQTIPPDKAIPINLVNQRRLAIVSLLFFLMGSALGAYFYTDEQVGIYFLAALLFNLIVMLILEARLISNPSEDSAKPFYVFGFLFFLLPAAAHIVQRMLVDFS